MENIKKNENRGKERKKKKKKKKNMPAKKDKLSNMKTNKKWKKKKCIIKKTFDLFLHHHNFMKVRTAGIKVNGLICRFLTTP